MASATPPTGSVPQKPPPPGEVKPTAYAKRYGSSVHKIHAGTGKSGLTPLSPPPNLADLPNEEKKLWRDYERYQRSDMKGSTTWELKDLGALVDTEPVTNGLAHVPVHDFYKRSRWSQRDAPDIGPGVPGKWEARNNLVWLALLPSIKLASLVWTNTHLWPWVDALINGKRTKVTDAAVAADGGVPGVAYEFHLRSIWESRPLEQNNDILDRMAHLSSFSIFDGMQDGGNRNGMTRMSENIATAKLVRIHMTISWQNIYPLLRTDITASERLVQQFFVAKTLIHETAHAVKGFVAYPAIHPEPFFEDEEMSECGWSHENAIWGGTIRSIVSRTVPGHSNRARPVMALDCTNFPNFRDHFRDGRARGPTDGKRYRNHERFGDDAAVVSWPIPIYWIEQVQTQSFWESILPIYGAEVLVPPAVLGKKTVKGSKVNGKRKKTYDVLIGPDFRKWVKFKGVKGGKEQKMKLRPVPDVVPNLTEEQRWLNDNNRRVAATAVRIAERQKARWRMEWVGEKKKGKESSSHEEMANGLTLAVESLAMSPKTRTGSMHEDAMRGLGSGPTPSRTPVTGGQQFLSKPSSPTKVSSPTKASCSAEASSLTGPDSPLISPKDTVDCNTDDTQAPSVTGPGGANPQDEPYFSHSPGGATTFGTMTGDQAHPSSSMTESAGEGNDFQPSPSEPGKMQRLRKMSSIVAKSIGSAFGMKRKADEDENDGGSPTKKVKADS